MRARLIVQAPIEIPSFIGVGRIHQAGIELSTGDDGTRRVSGRAFIVRIRCKNHTLVTEERGTFDRKHIGDAKEIQREVARLMGNMPTLISDLKALWSHAAAAYYLDESGANLSAPEAITRLVQHGHLPLGGLDTAAAIDAYVSAWRAEESPHSVAGVIMAVQRAAHETSWRTKWADESIEETAAELLAQPVYVQRLSQYAD